MATSKEEIPPLRTLFNYLNGALSPKELEEMILLVKGEFLAEKDAADMTSSLKLFVYLETHGHLSVENVGLLIELMEYLKRPPLKKVIEEFKLKHKVEGTATALSSGRHISDASCDRTDSGHHSEKDRAELVKQASLEKKLTHTILQRREDQKTIESLKRKERRNADRIEELERAKDIAENPAMFDSTIRPTSDEDYNSEKSEELANGQCVSCPEERDLQKCDIYGAHFCSSSITPHKIMETSVDSDDAVLLDIYLRDLAEEHGQSQVYCKSHKQHKVHMFCESCKESICPECIAAHPPSTHNHKYIKDAAASYRTQLKKMMDQLKKQKECAVSQDSGDDTCNELKTFQEEENKKIDDKAKRMISKVKTEQLRLKKMINVQYEMMKLYLSREFDELEEKHGNVYNACYYLELLLSNEDDVLLLSSKKETEQNIENFMYKLDRLITSYLTKFKPSRDTPEHGMLGALEMNINASMCKVENMPKRLVRGEAVVAKVTCSDGRGNKVTPYKDINAKLIKGDNSSKDISVESHEIGEYILNFEADVAGVCEVTVKLGDQPIPGSPFIISIQGLVRSIGEGQLRSPTGIVTNWHGDFVTTDVGKQIIYVTDKEGNFKLSFTFNEFKNQFQPQGVAISDDNKYFMTDAGNDQVVVSDENGKMLSSFGQNEIRHANGIGISPLDGSVYVTDWDGKSDEDETEKKGSHCVRKFTQSGQYITSFGNFGTKEGEFWGPNYVAINGEGESFITDSNNYRIQVFNKDCEILYLFSTEHSLLNPRGIVIDKDGLVYVCDRQLKGVLQLSSHGDFLSRIDSDKDKLEWPHGITLTNEIPYKVAVVEHRNGCIKIFAQ